MKKMVNFFYLVDVDFVSASTKSSKVKAKWSGRVYFGVSGSLEGMEETVALLKKGLNRRQKLVSYRLQNQPSKF